MHIIKLSIIRSLFSLILGIVLISFSDAAVKYIVMTVGLLFILPGMITLAIYYGNKINKIEAYTMPIEAVASIILGTCLLLFPTIFANALIFVLGLILTIGGFNKISVLYGSRKATNVNPYLYIIPALIFFSGILIMFNPVSTQNFIMNIIGSICILYAVSEIIEWIAVGRKIAKVEKNKKDTESINIDDIQ